MKLFIAFLLLIMTSSFAVAKDTVIINTIRSQIDTVFVEKDVYLHIESVTDSSICIKISEGQKPAKKEIDKPSEKVIKKVKIKNKKKFKSIKARLKEIKSKK